MDAAADILRVADDPIGDVPGVVEREMGVREGERGAGEGAEDGQLALCRCWGLSAALKQDIHLLL